MISSLSFCNPQQCSKITFQNTTHACKIKRQRIFTWLLIIGAFSLFSNAETVFQLSRKVVAPAQKAREIQRATNKGLYKPPIRIMKLIFRWLSETQNFIHEMPRSSWRREITRCESIFNRENPSPIQN